MNSRALALALMAWAIPAPSAAQAPRDSATAVTAFVQTVRAATERYRDQAMAVVDGYRPIGPDFPGMGEHWISVPLLLGGVIDPQRPQILEYARLNGEMTLVGAAFAVLLKAHESPPAIEGLPVDASAWHFHGGKVDEESFVSEHAEGAQAHHNNVRHNGPRVAVLHVWAWLDNPSGPFATDNWALPFARLGLPVPAMPPSVDVAQGLALAAGATPYYLRVMAMRDPARVMAPGTQERLERVAEEMRALLRREPLDVALQRVGEMWVGLGVAPAQRLKPRLGEDGD